MITTTFNGAAWLLMNSEKIYSLGESVYYMFAYRKSSKNEPLNINQKIDLVAHACFTLVQIGDLASDFTKASPKLKLGLRIGAGTMEVSKLCTGQLSGRFQNLSNKDYLYLASYTFIIRTVDCAQLRLDQIKEVVCTQTTYLSYVIPFGTKTSYCIAKWGTLKSISSKLLKYYNIYFGSMCKNKIKDTDILVIKLDEMFIKWLRKDPERKSLLCPCSFEFLLNPIKCKKNPSLCIEKTVLITLYKNNEEHFKIGEEKFAVSDFESDVDMVKQLENRNALNILQDAFQNEQIEKIKRIYKKLSEPEKLTKIPKWLAIDKRFIFKCKISKKPILFPIVPNIDTVHTVYYEEQEIKKWINEKPNELPPEWPQDLPFNNNNLRRCLRARAMILESLEMIYKEIATDEEL